MRAFESLTFNMSKWRIMRTCDVTLARYGHSDAVVGEAEISSKVLDSALESQKALQSLVFDGILDRFVFIFDFPHEIDFCRICVSRANENRFSILFRLGDRAFRFDWKKKIEELR